MWDARLRHCAQRIDDGRQPWACYPLPMADSRNLRVLDAAYHLVSTVHAASDRLDVDRVPGLRNQLLRATDAVPANVAEGARRTSRAEFARYLRIALGSADEVGTHLRIAWNAKALETSDFHASERLRVTVCRMLHHLIRSLEEADARERNDTMVNARAAMAET